MINDLHSIATNLDAHSLQQIAVELNHITSALWCLIMIMIFRFAVDAWKLAVLVDSKRTDRIEEECSSLPMQ